MSQLTYPASIRLVEVGPRDGFQMEERFIPTELKIESVERLVRSGVREIEAVSFVHPRVIPQMRDAGEVMAGVERVEGVRYWALVPNLRGAERALAHEVSGVHVVICVTESYNQKNVGMSVSESLAGLGEIVREVDGRVPVAVTLAATFGCPFEGQLPTSELVDIAARAADAGVDQIGLADSTGLGYPPLVREVVRAVRARLPEMELRFHLHDTRGLGLANTVVGLEEGIEVFDTSFGGLGGCPVIRGATGNVATEDLLNLSGELGIETGVDLQSVREVSARMEAFLERSLPAKLLQSGTRDELLALNRGA